MSESTLNARLTGPASLAAIGQHLNRIDLLSPIRKSVQIKQKTVKYTPFDKLRNAFVLLLTGAHRMVEINTSLRADPALCQAFGIHACAEQSVVQDTLDAGTDDTVEQMQQAMNCLFRAQSRAYRHDYHAQFQLLDIDLSGRVCGKGAQDATKGYFRGRALRGVRKGASMPVGMTKPCVCACLRATPLRLRRCSRS